MAEKRPKSILSGLKNMLHMDSSKPSASTPKPASQPQKKPKAEQRAAEKPKEPQAAAPAAEAPAAADPAAEPTPDKGKVKNQPWYRHRQRW